MRKNTRSLFIYVVFGILIAVFIYSFGPQAGNRNSGCSSPESASAMRVNGHEITETSWRYGILAFGQGSASGERARRGRVRERVLDGLIVRELLAEVAGDLGFHISDQEVWDRIGNGDLLILGQKYNGKRAYFVKDEGDDEPRFVKAAFSSFVRTLGLGSPERFAEEQKRELLAQKVRDLLGAAVRVSPEEVQQAYQLDNSKVALEYVPFSKAGYRDGAELSSAEVDEYLTKHEADLKAQFEKEADRWKGREKEVRLRDLFVKSERTVEPPAPPKPGEAPKPPEPAKDPAKDKAEAALAKIKGGADFATVLKATSPDAKRGGDLGWRPMRGLRLGAAASAAIDKLEKGATSEVLETPEGYHIVQVIDRREGNLTFDQVKRDLAEDAALDDKAKAAAKADAEKALAAAQGGQALEKLYPNEGGDTPVAGKPRLQKVADVARGGGYVQGIGTAPDLVKALFDELKVGDLGPKVYEVAGDYFVVRLTKRDEPDMDKFQKEKRKLAAQMQERKSDEAVASFMAGRCRVARDKGAISYDENLVRYNDSDKAAKTGYQPCATLR